MFHQVVVLTVRMKSRALNKLLCSSMSFKISKPSYSTVIMHLIFYVLRLLRYLSTAKCNVMLCNKTLVGPIAAKAHLRKPRRCGLLYKCDHLN